MLTLERAKELNDSMVTEEHLRLHAKNVMYAMGAMADHFGEDRDYWMAVGYLHDYDYEKYPDEHLKHTQQPLLDAGVDPDAVRAILSHGYGICTDIKPETNLVFSDVAGAHPWLSKSRLTTVINCDFSASVATRCVQI